MHAIVQQKYPALVNKKQALLQQDSTKNNLQELAGLVSLF